MIRILHVDDNPLILDLSQRYLQKMGKFEVTTEINPLVASRMDTSGFDAIVSDFEMSPLNGIELLTCFRQQGISLPFILLTGRGNDAIILKALSNGAASYLQKTANPRAMFTELATILQKEVWLHQLNGKSLPCGPVSLDAKLFDNLPEPAFAINMEGCIIAWNLAAAQMTGIESGSVIGTGWQQYSRYFGGISRHMAVEALLQGDPVYLEGYEVTLCTRTLIIGKRTVLTPYGNSITYWEKNSLITGSNGTPEGAVVIIRDLTQRRSIITQNKVMRDQLSAIADCMIGLGPSFRENINSILSIICRFCGVTVAGYIKKRHHRPDFVCTHSGPLHNQDEETFRTYLIGLENRQTNFLPAGWYPRTFDISPKSQVLLGFSGAEETTFCDSFIRLLIGAIASEERKYAATEEMDRSEERYRMIFENAPVALFEHDYSGVYQRLQTEVPDRKIPGAQFTLDPDNITSLMKEVRLTGMNQASYRLLGTDSPSSMPPMQIIGATEGAQSLFLKACTCITEKKETFSAYEHLVLPDHQERDIYLNWVVPRQIDQYRSVLVSMVDITEQKRIENSLRQANKKLNTLTMITRHDIKNQLTALSGFLEVIRSEIPEGNVTGWSDSCLKICTRINDIITFTREYEQIGLHQPGWADISSLIHTEDLKAGFPSLSITTGVSPVSIYADAMFPLVIWNLIDNVVRHAAQATSVSISGYRENKEYTLIVEDDGPGIPESEKEKIFDRGYGTNTGLGLFLVRENPCPYRDDHPGKRQRRNRSQVYDSDTGRIM